MSSSISLTIIFRGKRRTMDYVEGDTVLESARRAGLSPPFSCEAGNCATCMAFLKEGSVTMRANEALEPDEVEDGLHSHLPVGTRLRFSGRLRQLVIGDDGVEAEAPDFLASDRPIHPGASPRSNGGSLEDDGR